MLVHVAALVAHHRERDDAARPHVVVFDLGHGDVELGLHPVGDTTQHLPLALERARRGDVESDARDADEHDRSFSRFDDRPDRSAASKGSTGR
jgi:hypothetical protein